MLSAVPTFLGGATIRDHFHLPYTFEIIRFLPLSLWFTWYMGFLLADALLAGKLPTLSARLILIFAIGLYLLSNLYRPLTPFKLPLSGIMLGLMAWEYLSLKVKFQTFEKIIGYLGVCSYSFYLYFDKLIPPCLHFVKSFISQPISNHLLFIIAFPATLLVIFMVSYLLYFMIERKSIDFGRYLDRYFMRLGERR